MSDYLMTVGEAIANCLFLAILLLFALVSAYFFGMLQGWSLARSLSDEITTWRHLRRWFGDKLIKRGVDVRGF